MKQFVCKENNKNYFFQQLFSSVSVDTHSQEYHDVAS